MTFEEWCSRRDIVSGAVEGPTLKVLRGAYGLLSAARGVRKDASAEMAWDGAVYAFLHPSWADSPGAWGVDQEDTLYQHVSLEARVARLEHLIYVDESRAVM